MKQPIIHLSKKYFFFLCCFLVMTNNAFAVKSVDNPVQKIEAISDPTPSVLILNHRYHRFDKKRSQKIIQEGEEVKVCTKNKQNYKGKLKVIDENYIEVGGQKIALEHIVRIKHKRKRKKMFFGIGFILLGFLITLVIAATANGVNSDDSRIVLFLAFIAIFVLVPIGILILLFPTIYSSRSWKFQTMLKDDVLYRRSDD